MTKPNMDKANDALDEAREIATTNRGHYMPDTVHAFVEFDGGPRGDWFEWVAMVICDRCNAVIMFDVDGDPIHTLAETQGCAGRKG